MADVAGVVAILLAAGRSVRMGGPNKLLLPVDGEPMVRRSARAVLAAGLPVVVVTGHRAEAVRAALDGLSLSFVHNPEYESGLSSSLRTGTAAVAATGGAAALVCLGDMPWVRPDTIARLAAAHSPGAIVAPVKDGQRGNPVLWDQAFFASIMGLQGDTGARELLRQHSGALATIDTTDSGIFRDVDTPLDFS